jgi:hypothetical protein
MRTIRIGMREVYGQDVIKHGRLRRNLLEFFKKNRYPKDSEVHAFADEMGVPEEELEQAVYSILTDFLAAGERYKNPDVPIDPKQLRMGIKVEMEHTDCPLISERIALDHLVEFPDYYSRLEKMEQEGESALRMKEETDERS